MSENPFFGMDPIHVGGRDCEHTEEEARKIVEQEFVKRFASLADALTLAGIERAAASGPVTVLTTDSLLVISRAAGIGVGLVMLYAAKYAPEWLLHFAGSLPDDESCKWQVEKLAKTLPTILTATLDQDPDVRERAAEDMIRHVAEITNRDEDEVRKSVLDPDAVLKQVADMLGADLGNG